MSTKNTTSKTRTSRGAEELKLCFDRVVPEKYKPRPTPAQAEERAVMPWLTRWTDRRELKM